MPIESLVVAVGGSRKLMNLGEKSSSDESDGQPGEELLLQNNSAERAQARKI